LEFKCREHGVQRGTPIELLEVAPIDEPPLSAPQKPARPSVYAATAKKLPRSGPRVRHSRSDHRLRFGSAIGSFKEETETVLVKRRRRAGPSQSKTFGGDTVTLIDRITGTEKQVRVASVERYTERESRVGLAFLQPLPGFWRRARKKPRVPKALRVVVKGKDAQGRAFKQSAFTVDVSKDGARLDGVGLLTTSGQNSPGPPPLAQSQFPRGLVGQIGTAESNQVGLYALNAGKNIWNITCPTHSIPSPPHLNLSKK